MNIYTPKYKSQLFYFDAIVRDKIISTFGIREKGKIDSIQIKIEQTRPTEEVKFSNLRYHV